jgi:NAD(P)H-dependent FMN reductase
VGSLRKESYNLKTAKALIALAPESSSLEIVSIGELPLFKTPFSIISSETELIPMSYIHFQ